MTLDELGKQIQDRLQDLIMNPDSPRPKTTEEADALFEQGQLKLWGMMYEMMMGDPRKAVLIERGHGLERVRHLY